MQPERVDGPAHRSSTRLPCPSSFEVSPFVGEVINSLSARLQFALLASKMAGVDVGVEGADDARNSSALA